MSNRNNVLRFLYLNVYSFLIFFAGILTLVLPFFLINKWILIAQAIVAIKLFMISGRLFLSWKDKLKEIEILTNRNKAEFRPDTFVIFMQAPCGRLVVRQVLFNLNKQNEYKSLLKLKKPFIENMRENCKPAKTTIFIREDVL